jgi:LCP family protein required for cell wall assembly
VAGLVLMAGGVGHAMVTDLDTGIERIDPFEGLEDRPESSNGVNFLLVGTDGRDRISQEEKKKYRLGGTPCHCTDTIMLAHLSGDKKRVSMVSIPRDSHVEVPEHIDPNNGQRHPARGEKINAAHAHGGPRLTVRTVEKATGVHIDHYLEVDFTSFMKTVDVLGGVEICVARPMRDSHTGLNLPPGRSLLNGGEALQYVRSRYVDGAADLGRMKRQQRFMAAVMDQVASGGVLMNPVQFGRAAATLLGSVRADKGFGTDELIALGRAMRGFTPASSEFTSVPISDPGHVVPGLGSTVEWHARKAAKLFAALRADQPLAAHRAKRKRAVLVEVPPRQIRVQVDNGTTTPGLGARVDRALRATGFSTTGAPRNAARSDVRHTVIAHDPGWDRSARSLADALPGAELRPVAKQGPRMRVTVGGDFSRVQRVRADDDGAITGDEVVCH